MKRMMIDRIQMTQMLWILNDLICANPQYLCHPRSNFMKALSKEIFDISHYNFSDTPSVR